MRFNNWTMAEVKEHAQLFEKKIICYGAGMVAFHMLELFEQYDMLDSILFWIDSNPDKHGTYIAYANHRYEVKDKQALYASDNKNKILVLSCENYKSILGELLEDKENTILDCCAYVYANNQYIANALKREGKIAFKNTSTNYIIPPIIHCCWFGNKKIPDEFQRNIEGWRALCPDYQIYCWNEDNYNVNENVYVREAFEHKQYAFVSDYVRMDVVYKYGGFYFDTDVKLMKNLDCLRGNEAFFSFGKWPAVNSGSGFAAVKQHALVKEIRDNPRSKKHFFENGKVDKTTNLYYETAVLKKYGFSMNFMSQEVNGVLLLSPQLFPTATYLADYEMELESVIGIHYDAGTWRDKDAVEGMFSQ